MSMGHLLTVAARSCLTIILILALGMGMGTAKTLASTESIATNKLYVSLDEHGNKRYSDQKPKSGAYETKQQTQVKTVVWQKSESIPLINPKNHNKTKSKPKSKQADQTKQQYCQKLLSDMKSLERQLEYKQKASQFDSLKKKLRNIRWQYQTKC